MSTIIIWNIIPSLKTPVIPSSLPSNCGYFYYAIFFPFLEHYVIGITKYVTFSDWLFLSNMRLSSLKMTFCSSRAHFFFITE